MVALPVYSVSAVACLSKRTLCTYWYETVSEKCSRSTVQSTLLPPPTSRFSLPPRVKLGYTLNPDEEYTLEDLLKLDLEPFQEEIDKVLCVADRRLEGVLLGRFIRQAISSVERSPSRRPVFDPPRVDPPPPPQRSPVEKLGY